MGIVCTASEAARLKSHEGTRLQLVIQTSVVSESREHEALAAVCNSAAGKTVSLLLGG